MLDIAFIREHPDIVRSGIRAKGAAPELVDRVLECDSEWRRETTALQDIRNHLNARSREIGQLMRDGRKDQAQEAIQETTRLKTDIASREEAVRSLEADRMSLLLEIPNVPHPSVPIGSEPSENVVVETWGKPADLEFTPMPHWELLDLHQLADFERGAKVSGAGFPFYLGKGAQLQRALIAFFLDLATTSGGYTEVQPPILVSAESATATGNLPDKEDQMYEISRDGLYPVPTAEVPITNYFRDEILDASELPVKLCAYTPCFRREAGSYGKDVRGLNRLHQFDKVELVQFVTPDSSYEALESMCADAERAVQALELPYRKLLMCSGDMGFTQTKKYDLEVWSPGQERWLEVSSISNFEAYQSRRAGIRYRPESDAKPAFVHTLNGSGLALPRIVAALIETGQRKDGSIVIPDKLVPFTGFEQIP